MHTLAHCKSDNLQPSSRGSKNDGHVMGKAYNGRGNGLAHGYTMSMPKLLEASYSPHLDLKHHLDDSDSDDCESIGSNPTPPLNFTHTRYDNHPTPQITQCAIPIPSNNHPTKGKAPQDINRWTNNANNVIMDKRGGNEGGPQCGANNVNNLSRKFTPKEILKRQTTATTTTTRNACKGIMDKNEPREETITNAQFAPKENLRSLQTYSSSSRSSLKSSPLFTNKDTKISINHIKPNENINQSKFDEGDGGGPPMIKTHHKNNKEIHHDQHKNNHNQTPYHTNLELVDDGDGSGYGGQYRPTYEGRYGNGYTSGYEYNKKYNNHNRRQRRTRYDSQGSSKLQSKHGSQGSSKLQSRHSSQASSKLQSKHSSRGSSKLQSRHSSQESSKLQFRHNNHQSRNKGSNQRWNLIRDSHKNSRSSSCNSRDTSCTNLSRLSTISVNTPYPAKWRCFGRRPPAIMEFRPLGVGRVENVRPAGKVGYLVRDADKRNQVNGLRNAKKTSDMWDLCYGLAKPLVDQWATPLPYGTHIVRVGDIDPYFHPSRGDIVIINPAQIFYRAMKSGYVMTYQGCNYSFGVGDLIIRLGRFMPSKKYIPYGNLELYMHTQTRDMRLLGCQPFLLVDFNYHNLDYESPGKYLAIGTFLNEAFFPRRGDIIIRGGAWAENYPNIHRKYHSLVKYWRPRMQFLPNDMLLRPYVDIGGCKSKTKFYWGAIELYTYSGKGLAWAYWGRDHHICDTPYPHEHEHGIKTGHHKDEVGHYATR